LVAVQRAIFVTREQTISIIEIPDMAPPAMDMCRRLCCPILLQGNPPNGFPWMRLRFERVSSGSEMPVYEESLFHEEKKQRHRNPYGAD
jgi:hypothetical protein